MKTVKVILNKDVANLGEEGDVRDVKRGFARNYLIPKLLVVPFSKHNAAILESRKKSIEKRREEKRQEALGLKDKIEALEIVFSMPAGDNGKLFGAVTNTMVAEALEKEGVVVERKKVEITDHTIKTVGNHTAKVKLYDNQIAALKVTINKAETKDKA
jgi:large subunit ribosomal protein L9